jgi:hypothetical protein
MALETDRGHRVAFLTASGMIPKVLGDDSFWDAAAR